MFRSEGDCDEANDICAVCGAHCGGTPIGPLKRCPSCRVFRPVKRGIRRTPCIGSHTTTTNHGTKNKRGCALAGALFLTVGLLVLIVI